jgi:hypothetical protein
MNLNGLTREEAKELNRYLETKILVTKESKTGFRLYRRAKDIHEYINGLGIPLRIPFTESEKEEIEKLAKCLNGNERLALQHLALIYVIEAFKRCPYYLPIKCYYPHIFSRRYSQARFRPRAIQEFERFLNVVLEINKGSEAFKQLRIDIFYNDRLGKVDPDTMTNRREEYYITDYIEMLCRLYLAEYEYAKIEPLLDTLISWGDTGALYFLIPEFFRRQNRLDRGIQFLQSIKEKYKVRGIINHDISQLIDEKIALMAYWKKALKPYKPRPRKKKPVMEDIISI